MAESPPLLQVVLLEPEIPHNTGNVVRLCANVGAGLHLVEPLGFAYEDKRLRRAHLDYDEAASVRRHPSFAACRAALGAARVLAVETSGKAALHDHRFAVGDVLLFGSESRGLPTAVLATLPPERILRLPMRAGSRSLNLANAVAIALYEAWRQLGFPQAARERGAPGISSGFDYCAEA